MIAVSDHPPVPGYELLRLRGRNGHLVYLARQSSSGRLVHLNVVHSSGDFGRMVADGLRQQAALLATLYHPNILRPVEVGGLQDYGFFSALEYAEGGCLADRVQTGPLPSTEAAIMARAIAGALQYARSRNVVQADLTPGSVLLTGDNVPKVADFRPAGGGHGDRLGARVFTPGYVAPEEVTDSEGVGLTPATDVYRIGALLYAMLTGQPPFSPAGDPIRTIRQVLDRSPAPVLPRNSAVPAELEAVCVKCLEKQPAHRYAEPGDLVDVLGQFLAESQPQA
jgi:eukaryotic-like serine/threonine-protein kinase